MFKREIKGHLNIYWDELKEIWKTGASLLVYQHYPTIKREIFHANMASMFRERIDAKNVKVFRTSYVAFFLVLQDIHVEELSRRAMSISHRWQQQIKLEEL